MMFREIYIGHVEKTDFTNYARGELGTRTSSLNAIAMERFRQNWIYRDVSASTRRAAKRGKAAQANEK
jgi:hypothetical protein